MIVLISIDREGGPYLKRELIRNTITKFPKFKNIHYVYPLHGQNFLADEFFPRVDNPQPKQLTVPFFVCGWPIFPSLSD